MLIGQPAERVLLVLSGLPARPARLTLIDLPASC
ncbi:hypothetical protein EDF36_0187 [Rathayibacter sp. PhB152]|nr:hypothetical protein EDF36_0187 [Rathayibacter sp. PhB152]ROS22163.1 hypothetical protein EDF22_3669 [Rathayibacter sp. PhB127]